MANSANTTPAHERNRTAAERKAGSAIGLSSVTARESQSQADTARAAMVAVMRRWAESRTIVEADPERKATTANVVNRFVVAGFALMKKSAGSAAKKEHRRLVTLHEEKLGPEPHGKELDAGRNGSKGIRQRRRPLENFQEYLEAHPTEAAATVAEKSTTKWTEKCDTWATLKRQRCESSKMKITVGIDSAGLLHSLGPNYRTDYVVQTRTGPDGKPEEFCEVTIGPKGATENIEVVIQTRPSGEVYKQMRRVVTESRLLLANARKFLTDAEDEQTPQQFRIPTVA